MSLNLRSAREDDAAHIVTWFTTRKDEILWGGGDIPDPLNEKWLGQVFQTELYWVLDDPLDQSLGGPAGVFGLDYFVEENRAHLRRFAIAPAKRGQGHGRDLLSEAMREARLLGAGRLSLGVYSSNPVAIRLYERAGFQVSGERRHNEDSSGLSFIMQLNL